MDITQIHGVDSKEDCEQCNGKGFIDPPHALSVGIEIEPVSGRITISLCVWRCACTNILAVSRE